MVTLLESKPSAEQLEQMLEALDIYIKLAVDVDREILAGGGALHADCETVLLENGCVQENIWGADWLPQGKRVTFESLINIRPRQNNLSLEVQDEKLKIRIEKIVRKIFEDETDKES